MPLSRYLDRRSICNFHQLVLGPLTIAKIYIYRYRYVDM